MKMHNLGSTGVQVSEHCLGAMMFGKMGNPDHDECVRIMHRALDAGMNFIDTADVYSAGRVGGDRRQGDRGARRDDVVLATRCTSADGRAIRTCGGNSRRWIMREVENSLRRLGTDWIDLYQMHRPDEAADVDETLGALERPRAPGQDPVLGVVDVPRRVHRGGAVGRRASRPRAVPVRAAAVLDLRARGSSASVLPTCQRYGMGVIPWSPLAGGWLAGRYRKGAELPPDSRMARRFGGPFEDERQRTVHEQRARRGRGAAEGDWPMPASRSRTWRIAFVARAPGGDLGDHRARAPWSSSTTCSARRDVRLDADALDRIDEIVPPGTSISGADPWQPRALTARSRRRSRG